MVYELKYEFNGNPFSFEDEKTEKAYERQYEPIVIGLALSSAEKYHHEPYGKYTEINLFLDGELVWARQSYDIPQPNAQLD